jgi:Amt family ammonium transporter
MLCYVVVTRFKPRFGIDDSLDAFGVHAVGGIWGTFATGIFARAAINPAGADGLLFGGLRLFGVQAFVAAVCITYSMAVTYALYKAIDALLGMRVDREEEILGLDLTQHKEMAYTLLD